MNNLIYTLYGVNKINKLKLPVYIIDEFGNSDKDYNNTINNNNIKNNNHKKNV